MQGQRRLSINDMADLPGPTRQGLAHVPSPIDDDKLMQLSSNLIIEVVIVYNQREFASSKKELNEDQMRLTLQMQFSYM